MRSKPQKLGFELSISAGADGNVQAVYIRLLDNKIAKTVEIEEDVLMADYDSRGRLVGIEILAPVPLSNISKLVEPPRRKPFSRLVREQAPSKLVLA